jgi:putative two-component system response regulator
MTSRTTTNAAPKISDGNGTVHIPAPMAGSRGCRVAIRPSVRARSKAPAETHVLIVDDEQHIREAMKRILSRAGYDCTLAASMREAHGLLETRPFDLLLCDLMMPEESGFTLLAHVGSTYPELAVLIVSGIDNAEVAEPAANAGADGYIMKPFNANSILINVVGALRRRAALVDTTQALVDATHWNRLERRGPTLETELRTALQNGKSEWHGAVGRSA